MARYALPYLRQIVGPDAHFGIDQLVELLLILDERDEALALIERFRHRFVLSTIYGARQGRFAPELQNEPQFSALLESLELRRAEETAEIDRRIVSGEIVLP